MITLASVRGEPVYSKPFQMACDSDAMGVFGGRQYGCPIRGMIRSVLGWYTNSPNNELNFHGGEAERRNLFAIV
jgi:hypothetical protein